LSCQRIAASWLSHPDMPKDVFQLGERSQGLKKARRNEN